MKALKSATGHVDPPSKFNIIYNKKNINALNTEQVIKAKTEHTSYDKDSYCSTDDLFNGILYGIWSFMNKIV